jgi:hypothetical protein
MTEQESLLAGLRKGLNEALDVHGYGFQHAVVRAFKELLSRGRSPWSRPTVEFPVEARGKPTRIDIVLEHPQADIWLVCECKRVNPAYADWCFLRAPFSDRGSLARQVYLESLVWVDGPRRAVTRPTPLHGSDRIYHLGIEVKGTRQGDPRGRSAGAIEDAVTQVLRGQNGLIDFLGHSERAATELKVLSFLPVVITTANLWVTDADLSEAELASGHVDLSASSVTDTEWLWYHYPQSPGLKHQLLQKTDDTCDHLLTEALYSTFVRPIAVVSAAGLEAFCQQAEFLYW